VNQAEISKLFSMIDIDYPSNKIGRDESNQDLVMARWLQKLGGFDSRTVYSAYEAYVAKNARFAPGWQDLTQIIAENMTGSMMPAEEAWGKIQTAIRRFGYTEEDKARAWLGEQIWTVVSRFGWRYFCQMPIESEATYFAQFRNSYDMERRRAAEQIQLSPGVISHLKALGGVHDNNLMLDPPAPRPPQQIEQPAIDPGDGTIDWIIETLQEAKRIALEGRS
jgi:hypothetical protein